MAQITIVAGASVVSCCSTLVFPDNSITRATLEAAPDREDVCPACVAEIVRERLAGAAVRH